MKKKVQIDKTVALKAAMREYLDTQELITKLDNDITKLEWCVSGSKNRKQLYMDQIVEVTKVVRRWFINQDDLKHALTTLLNTHTWYFDECKTEESERLKLQTAQDDRCAAFKRLKEARAKLDALLA
jgi:hypothetical protein